MCERGVDLQRARAKNLWLYEWASGVLMAGRKRIEILETTPPATTREEGRQNLCCCLPLWSIVCGRTANVVR